MLVSLRPSAPGDEVNVSSPETLHPALARWRRQYLAPRLPGADWLQEIAADARMLAAEGAWLEAFRAEIAPLAEAAPSEPEAFMAWFEALKQTGPGQNDPLFDWLAEEADLDAMRWFLTQEAAGEAGFEDLVAMTQVKLPNGPKLELARNFWDEMGRGNEGGMHGPMLGRTVSGLGLEPAIETTVWPSLALANTMTAFAATRRYVYHAIGALGVVELTAPTRVAKVAQGLKRLACEPSVRKYFDLHAVLDVRHAEDWNREAIRPLVESGPAIARAIAEGALMRLECGRRCFDAYRAHLWGKTPAQRTVRP